MLDEVIVMDGQQIYLLASSTVTAELSWQACSFKPVVSTFTLPLYVHTVGGISDPHTGHMTERRRARTLAVGMLTSSSVQMETFPIALRARDA